jgi:hypothetical protein
LGDSPWLEVSLLLNLLALLGLRKARSLKWRFVGLGSVASWGLFVLMGQPLWAGLATLVTCAIAVVILSSAERKEWESGGSRHWE